MHTDQMISRRRAMQGAGLAGLVTAAGLVMPAAASADGDLVVVDQMATGAFSDENCGPAANVVALKAVGTTPKHYSSNSRGNRAAVEDMRVRCGVSPSGSPGKKSVDYWGTAISDLIKGIKSYDVSASQKSYGTLLDHAAGGKPAILHIQHNLLVSDAGDYGHYVVACGTDSNGRILVSDPGRAQSIGVKGYTRSQLTAAQDPRGRGGVAVG